ncbi:MAG TPA: hypothetical protein VFU38_11285 [Candidatus Krumholzibacteria bacterium]|nr:hypothetical protein [Candidatus Krumholzibacteria bacterium]
MIAHARSATNSPRYTTTMVALFLCAAGASSCSDDQNLVDPNGRLCGGETGLGVLIQGRAEPFEFCVDDENVGAVLTSLNRYDVGAQVSNDEGDFVVRMVFAVRDFPASLRIVDTLAEATTDIDAVWLYYEEVPAGGDPIESAASSGGTFTLGVVDEEVATGTFKNVTFAMRDFSTGEPAGERKFAEGTFSISVKVPTATAPPVAVR